MIFNVAHHTHYAFSTREVCANVHDAVCGLRRGYTYKAADGHHYFYDDVGTVLWDVPEMHQDEQAVHSIFEMLADYSLKYENMYYIGYCHVFQKAFNRICLEKGVGLRCIRPPRSPLTFDGLHVYHNIKPTPDVVQNLMRFQYSSGRKRIVVMDNQHDLLRFATSIDPENPTWLPYLKSRMILSNPFRHEPAL